MNPPRATKAFTLIELIVVMATLGAVLAVSAPSLSDFFKGRKLKEEARQILALTRYAQNESISRSIQMLMWIDTRENSYGLRPLSEYDFNDFKSLEFQLPQGIQFEIDSTENNRTEYSRKEYNGTENVDTDETGIFFRPDGAIEEYSLVRIVLKDETDHSIEISKADGGYDYIIEEDDRDVGKRY